MKRLIFVFSLLSFAGGKIYAQKAYTYVRQNGTKLEKLGTAAFDVAAQSYPRVQFVDGKAVMSIGDTRVAALPMADGGELVVSYTTDVAEADLNNVSEAHGAKAFRHYLFPISVGRASRQRGLCPRFLPRQDVAPFCR